MQFLPGQPWLPAVERRIFGAVAPALLKSPRT
jgi:hypothetical protein